MKDTQTKERFVEQEHEVTDAGHGEVLVESGGQTARARITVTSPFEFQEGCFIFPDDFHQRIDFSWPDGSTDRWEGVSSADRTPIMRRLLQGLKNQR